MHETWKIFNFKSIKIKISFNFPFVMEIFVCFSRFKNTHTHTGKLKSKTLYGPHLHHNVRNATNFNFLFNLSNFHWLSLCRSDFEIDTHKTECKYLPRQARVLISIQICKHSDVLFVWISICWLLLFANATAGVKEKYSSLGIYRATIPTMIWNV